MNKIMEYGTTSCNRTVYAAPCPNCDYKNAVFVVVDVETGRAPSLHMAAKTTINVNDVNMDNEKFQNKYRIPSARAAWHDYSGGAYFISVCTGKNEHFFGEIVRNKGEAQMQLSTMGKLLFENLQNATVHYPYAEIPLFVVMPNHWHAIIFIDGNKTPYQRRNIECHIVDAVETRRANVETGRANVETGRANVETGRAPSLQSDTLLINEKMRQTDMLKGWLSIVVGGIKSAVTKFANENSIEFAWQTRFHDNIIRDQTAMNNICQLYRK